MIQKKNQILFFGIWFNVKITNGQNTKNDGLLYSSKLLHLPFYIAENYKLNNVILNT